MNMSIHVRGILAVILVSLFASGGCVSYRHGWQMKPAQSFNGSPSVMELAERMEQTAATDDQVEDLIDELKTIRRTYGENSALLTKLARSYLAMAVAYARDMPEQGEFLRLSMMYSEAALMQNPRFAAMIESMGSDHGTVAAAVAAGSVGSEEAWTLATWALASLMYYEECTSEVLKIRHRDTMLADIVTVINAISSVGGDEVKPLALALKGVAVAVRPKAKMVMAVPDFDAAVQAAPDSILVRWLQAKYLFANFGDKVSLAAAISQIKEIDLNSAGGFKPLNRAIRVSLEKPKR
ncbi:MAG TPA: hypothetical protein PLC24_04090 [Myxococcota bacterium]|nr:hypothetical protein [Myxococcota bacterium]HPV03726.1 hypothetical protein [Myxococcota bacterium]